MNETKTTKDLVHEWKEELIAEKMILDNQLKECKQQVDFAWAKYIIADDAAKQLEKRSKKEAEYKQLKSLSDELDKEHENLKASYENLRNEVVIKKFNVDLLTNEIDKKYPKNEPKG